MTQKWRADAACAEIDGELFFPTNYTSPVSLLQIEDAKQICSWCPVLAECRSFIISFEGSIRADGRTGIFAGLTPDERFAIHRRAARARETADVS